MQAPHLHADCQGMLRDPQRRCVITLYLRQRDYLAAAEGGAAAGAVAGDEEAVYWLQPRWLETHNVEGESGG